MLPLKNLHMCLYPTEAVPPNDLGHLGDVDVGRLEKALVKTVKGKVGVQQPEPLHLKRPKTLMKDDHWVGSVNKKMDVQRG
eukprot:CAMPEP_0114164496 /NCGR_PEP_ID=MMETSP0043_2-20121206/30684_1 /TAXON_ID=464988 /ORGANISM="Hemiselmis andersenii, Strain CCMP644" /LENGTH=80 /DNA_ID=CAMNT_0001261131 /DNA_START=137 /DNA_END=378 /DNA_ORIENTATION=-